MSCQPGDVSCDWEAVLAHRPPETRRGLVERFEESGIGPERVRLALLDGGDGLHAAAASASPDWADPVGGPLAAALLAAEVSAFAAHLNSRASAVRAMAVEALLDDYSAITVAARLGVSRQKVYEISRGAHAGSFIPSVPWRQQP
jgi:hypothetical protein